MTGKTKCSVMFKYVPLPMDFRFISFDSASNLEKGMPQKKIPSVMRRFPAPLILVKGGCDCH